MRFIALDSLRGIAAILVALFHLTAAGTFYDLPVVRHGSMAVPLFFVLSGFVITHAYNGERLQNPGGIRFFLLRRFGRLYPLHIMTLSMLVILEFGKFFLVNVGVQSGQAPFSGTNDIPSLVANIFLLQAIIPMGEYTWNVPSWSISTEFFAYLFYASVAFAFGSRFRLAVTIFFFLFGSALVFLETSAFELHSTSGKGLLVCLFGFFTGAMTYQAFLFCKKAKIQIGSVVSIASVSCLVLIFWYKPFGAFFSIIYFAVIILIIAFYESIVGRALSISPLRYLGKISYSVYLVHFVVLSALNGFLRAAQSALHVPLYQGRDNMINFGPAWAMDILTIAYLIVVIAVASVTYRFVEVPGRNFFNLWSEGFSARQALLGSFRKRHAPAWSPGSEPTRGRA